MTGGGHWGTVPDWLAAVGTVGTLLVTVRLLVQERRDRLKRDEFERSAQARDVRISDLRRGTAVHAGTGRLICEFIVEVHNNSGDAVHDVEVAIEPLAGDDLVAPPPENYDRLRENNGREWCRVLNVGDTFVALAEYDIPDGVKAAQLVEHLAVSACFTDMAGTRWRRDKEHRLTLLEGKGQ